jgi:hypothetical protein
LIKKAFSPRVTELNKFESGFFMKCFFPLSQCLGAAVLMSSLSAFAHGNVQCPTYPKAEWQARELLQQKLVSEGWQVRRIEATKSCYEVYAKDPQGQKTEAFFDPKTFERVKS